MKSQFSQLRVAFPMRMRFDFVFCFFFSKRRIFAYSKKLDRKTYLIVICHSFWPHKTQISIGCPEISKIQEKIFDGGGRLLRKYQVSYVLCFTSLSRLILFFFSRIDAYHQYRYICTLKFYREGNATLENAKKTTYQSYRKGISQPGKSAATSGKAKREVWTFWRSPAESRFHLERLVATTAVQPLTVRMTFATAVW